MSLANYVIICNGRINVQAAHGPTGKIQAVSQCATESVKFYGDRITERDIKPISDLQHEMMDMLSGRRTVKNADEMVDEMFALLEELEDRMDS